MPIRSRRTVLPPADKERFRTVAIALAANFGVAGAKLAAALFTGSSAMLAEAFHASADTGNQLLLLVAQGRARRAPDQRHPLGHGREAYFWSLMASLGVFATGALLSLREGVEQLVRPTTVTSFPVAYVVLVVSFCLDGLSLQRAYRQIRNEGRTLGRAFFEHLDLSSDPISRAVFAEDAAAIIGNLVALTGIVLHQITGSPIPDGIAALLIAGTLCVVAFELARRNRAFLVGQEASAPLRSRIEQMIARQPGIVVVNQLLVTFLGPRQLWVVARIDIDDKMSGAGVKELQRATEAALKEQSPFIVRVDLVPSIAGKNASR